MFDIMTMAVYENVLVEKYAFMVFMTPLKLTKFSVTVATL